MKYLREGLLVVLSLSFMFQNFQIYKLKEEIESINKRQSSINRVIEHELKILQVKMDVLRRSLKMEI